MVKKSAIRNPKTTIRTSRSKSRPRKRRPWRRLFAYLGLFVLSLMVVGMTFLGVMLYQVSQLLPSAEMIQTYQPKESTQIYASDGSVLADIAAERREPAKLDEMPKHLLNATVAKEDRRFWQHKGVDMRGTMRAVWVNVTEGEIRQGGSTITQQLARNIFLSQRRTVTRKVQEIMLAQQMERHLTKEQILELYLNQVYYGNQAYGVKAAARVYFNKDLKKLTLSECALLAALPQRPSGYDPFANRDVAIEQRNLVLDLMLREGYITKAQCEAAKGEPLRLAKRRSGGLRFRAPYFVMDVLRQLEDQFGRDILYQGSMHVQTTLDPALQEAAERALQNGIRQFASQGVTQGAVVLMELQNGYIRALVGGRDFRESQYDAITQGRRQPGSSFKPIVYATAFELGKLTPTSTLLDAPLSFPGAGGKRWRPQNADGRYRGRVSVTTALTKSINVPAIRAMMLVGPENVAQFARERFGIESPLDPVLPLALGASAVKPLEMAKAFSTFATGGNRVEPIMVTKVTGRDNGVIMEQGPQIVPGVISEQTAKRMDEILRQAVLRGTGRAAAKIPDAHGKTGTTSDYRDAWFIGYTPRYIAVIWVSSAHYNPKTRQWEYLPMKRVFGGTVCARIWADMFEEINKIDEARAAKQAAERRNDGTQGRQDAEKQAADSRQQAADQSEIRTPNPEPRIPNPESPTEPATTQPPVISPLPSTADGTELRGSSSTPNLAEPARSSTPFAPPRNVQPETRSVPPAPPPEQVTVPICGETGYRANEYCPEVVTKAFVRGKEPKRPCRLHRPRG